MGKYCVRAEALIQLRVTLLLHQAPDSHGPWGPEHGREHDCRWMTKHSLIREVLYVGYEFMNLEADCSSTQVIYNGYLNELTL